MSHLQAVRIQHEVGEEYLAGLMELFGSAWWMAGRTVEETRLILRESDLLVVLIDSACDTVVGFARALTDYAHVALVLDVVVAPESRGSGYGALLVDTVVQKLSQVRSIELVCQPELVPFYSRWGFTNQVGNSRLMRRTSDPALVPRQLSP
ncbi:GNAT family N-acetyltransferase [Kribbella sp. NPDC026611]|uniref:GNAT family N-acetyltransferase n=1 Tax=Kribbella sp. NPDC026611 TaxID=3154911 RepID=UPI00340F12B4